VVVDQTAAARLQRLVRWLEQFKSCFGHRAQLIAESLIARRRVVERRFRWGEAAVDSSTHTEESGRLQSVSAVGNEAAGVGILPNARDFSRRNTGSIPQKD
jgi:hypothetical protein